MSSVNINLRLDKCAISATDENGNAIITDYRPETYNGEYITVETGVQTTITLKLDKYMGPASVPVLRYMKQYNTTILHAEDFIPSNTDAKEYVLTTDFSYCDNISGAAVLQISCNGIPRFAHVEMKLTNCTSNYPTGDYLAVETNFIITCNPGYEFQIEPSVVYGDKYDSYSDYLKRVDDTTYQITKTPGVGWDYIFTAEAIQKSDIIDKYGLITAYRPTKAELQVIADTRWQKRTYEPIKVDGTVVLYNATDEYIDTAKYVVSLLKLYTQLECTDKARLMFGPYDMGMDCDIISTDSIVLNCGSIQISGVYNNAIDFENTEIEAYLPFVGFVDLATTDFMEKEVSLQYRVNVLNGDSLAVLLADGKIMSTYPCNISFSVPYQLGTNKYVNRDLSPNTNYLLNEPPFIYVKTHNAANPAPTLPYNSTNFYSVLGKLSGYTEATEIDFDTLADYITKNEIDEIKSLIESGIFL